MRRAHSPELQEGPDYVIAVCRDAGSIPDQQDPFCIANILSRRKSALRVTVEIWPSGDKTRAHAIANVAHVSDLAEVSDYAVSAGQEYNPIDNTPPWTRHGYIFQHDRNNSVWALVAKVAAWAAEVAKTRR